MIGQSYVLPLQRFVDMWRVFWPAAAVWAAVLFVSEYFFALLGNDSPSVWQWIAMVFGWVYQSFIMASGLIRWHRHLIKDEAPYSSRLWLFAGEWRFWWRWFWLGIVATVIGILSMTIILMLLAVFGAFGGSPFEAASSELPDIFLLASIGVFFIGVFVIGMVACGWLFPRTLLSLAAIAVRESDSYRRIAREQVNRVDCFLLGCATLATTAPATIMAFFPLIFQEPIMADGTYDITFLYVAIIVFTNVINFFAVIVFATMLSLFYRSRVSAPLQAASAP